MCLAIVTHTFSTEPTVPALLSGCTLSTPVAELARSTSWSVPEIAISTRAPLSVAASACVAVDTYEISSALV
jgi:hypothetical protein